RVERLEERPEHDRHRDESGGDEGDVAHLPPRLRDRLSDEGADARAEREQVEDRLEDRRDRVGPQGRAVDVEVPPPDLDGPPGDVHQWFLSSRPRSFRKTSSSVTRRSRHCSTGNFSVTSLWISCPRSVYA